MSTKHFLAATFESAAVPGGPIELNIRFRYSPPGPPARPWDIDPPDGEEIEFLGASVGGTELNADDDLSIWAEQWLENHSDQAREQAA